MLFAPWCARESCRRCRRREYRHYSLEDPGPPSTVPRLGLLTLHRLRPRPSLRLPPCSRGPVRKHAWLFSDILLLGSREGAGIAVEDVLSLASVNLKPSVPDAGPLLRHAFALITPADGERRFSGLTSSDREGWVRDLERCIEAAATCANVGSGSIAVLSSGLAEASEAAGAAQRVMARLASKGGSPSPTRDGRGTPGGFGPPSPVRTATMPGFGGGASMPPPPPPVSLGGSASASSGMPPPPAPVRGAAGGVGGLAAAVGGMSLTGAPRSTISGGSSSSSGAPPPPPPVAGSAAAAKASAGPVLGTAHLAAMRSSPLKAAAPSGMVEPANSLTARASVLAPLPVAGRKVNLEALMGAAGSSNPGGASADARARAEKLRAQIDSRSGSLLPPPPPPVGGASALPPPPPPMNGFARR